MNSSPMVATRYIFQSATTRFLCIASLACLAAAYPQMIPYKRGYIDYPMYDKRGFPDYPTYERGGHPEYPVYDDGWDKPSLEDYLRGLQSPQEVTSFSTDGQGVGQVSGVDVAGGAVWLFHRADRQWGEETFDPVTNKLTDKYKAPIEKDTIFKVNSTTGKVISKLGKNIFSVPHGITVDGENIWVTDVGRHQVLRIPQGASEPDLELGEKFTPGSDHAHFCKPTDVVVASSGEVYVADGYCNSRIMKFDRDGKFLAEWGTANDADGSMTASSLNLPHSLALAEDQGLLVVADRENQRVVAYNLGSSGSSGAPGSYNATAISPGRLGRVFAVDYSPATGQLVAAVARDAPDAPRAASCTLQGRHLAVWAYPTSPAPSLIHTVAVSADGKDFFLGDVMQRKVTKFRVNSP